MNCRIRSTACSDFLSTGVTRRQALSVGGMGLLGLTVPRLLEAAEQRKGPAPRAKSIIFLYQFGGPSHLETFDMKPNAPEGIRGLFDTIETNVPGLRICEHLPETAKVMDKVTLIRSMHHGMKNHNSASYYALTGNEPPVDDIRLRDTLDRFPAYGSIVDRLAPVEDGMPTFVAYPYVIRDGSITPGQHASFLGKGNDPLLVTEDPNDSNFKLPELSLPENLSPERLGNRREIQKLIDRQSRLLEYSAQAQGLNAYYEKALSMLDSPRVRQAFDLSQEPDDLRDRYGRTTYGQSCLLARRLVEAGVKFVNVYFSSNIGGQSKTSGGWDTHGFNNTRMFPIMKAWHLPMTEHTLPVFLNDLDDRGLLDETLVVCEGEFGRSPKRGVSTSGNSNSDDGRDHWPYCYTALLAGAGIKRGYVHGVSDQTASAPLKDPVHPGQLLATIYESVGIIPDTIVYNHLNQPRELVKAESVPALYA
jgi:hypothetical protein